MAKKAKQELTLKLRYSEIIALAKRYRSDEKEFKTEIMALKAGKIIRRGECSRRNLETIFEWKTKGRGRSRLNKNSDEEIKDALQLACSAKTERAAMSVLRGLNGIDVPVASAVMTAVYTKRFTIIDFRGDNAECW